MSQLLSNHTVTLRPLEPTDLDTLYRWENDTALWMVSDTAAPYSREALWHYLKEYTGDTQELAPGSGRGGQRPWVPSAVGHACSLPVLLWPHRHGPDSNTVHAGSPPWTVTSAFVCLSGLPGTGRWVLSSCRPDPESLPWGPGLDTGVV